MNSLELLKEAIKKRKPISFEYNRDGRAIGLRYGHPHAIYISSANKVNVDIWKIDGVQTDPSQELPHWRTYTLNYIGNIKILKEKAQFSTAPKYKPKSTVYTRAIAKV